MSEQQTKKGKFKKVDLQGNTIEEWCEQQCVNLGRIDKLRYETWKEFFFDIYCDRFFIVNDELYEIIEIEDLYHNYYVQIDEQDDNTYSFYATYYDGGTCLTECLEDELKEIKFITSIYVKRED